MAVLQRCLAEQLGVSQMTVSRALRGESGISVKTRDRILEAARKAGLPLPPSQKLVDNKELLHALCTMVAETESVMESTSFHGRLTDGMRRGARECASELTTCSTPTGAWPLIVLRKQVDGLLMVWGDEHQPLPTVPCPVPQVYLFHGPPHADVVGVDNFGGGLQLGAFLAARGHRRVAFVGPETRMARERLSGLRTALEIAGGGCPPETTQLRLNAGGQEPEIVDGLLAGETRPEAVRERFTAIAAYNDWFAVHIVKRLGEIGFRVPEDISVTGFDHMAHPWYDGPQLTTCSVPVEELGAEAARFVYWRIEHPNAVRRALTLEAELVAGATVAAIAGR